jgi:hypothetical protein
LKLEIGEFDGGTTEIDQPYQEESEQVAREEPDLEE